MDRIGNISNFRYFTGVFYDQRNLRKQQPAECQPELEAKLRARNGKRLSIKGISSNAAVKYTQTPVLYRIIIKMRLGPFVILSQTLRYFETMKAMVCILGYFPIIVQQMQCDISCFLPR